MFHNLSKAELAIQECLRALNLAQTAQLHINDGAFADALRQIDELERTQLRLVEGYGFASKLRAWIPVQVGKVREHAAKDLQDWLANVRERSEQLGVAAMAQGAGQSGSLGDVDFEGLLASLHLFELMGRRRDFLSLLCEGRRQQLAILLEPQIVSAKDAELRGFTLLLEHLAGFFLVEYYLTLLPQDLYSLPFVEALWDHAIKRIQKGIDEASALSLPSPQQQQHYLLRLKEILVGFLEACQACPLPTARLGEAIDGLFFRFVELLKEQFGASLEENISGDSLEPLQVSSAELFQQLRSSFAFLRDPKYDEATSFPFTMSVVDLFQTIFKFNELFRSFLDGIRHPKGELCDIMRKAIDSYLLREANRLFLERLESTSDQRQLFAIYLNLTALEEISADIATLLGTRPLQAAQTFAESRAKALSVFQQRIKQAVEGYTGAYRSMNRAPEAKPVGPSRAAQEMVAFVTKTRAMLGENLDLDSQNLVFSHLFKTISDGIIASITDPAAPQMNLEFVQGMKSDLDFLLESFEHHLMDLNIFDALSELYQLALSKSCHEFTDPMRKQSTYGHLSSELVAAFLAKVSPSAQSKRSSIEDLVALLGKARI